MRLTSRSWLYPSEAMAICDKAVGKRMHKVVVVDRFPGHSITDLIVITVLSANTVRRVGNSSIEYNVGAPKSITVSNSPKIREGYIDGRGYAMACQHALVVYWNGLGTLTM